MVRVELVETVWRSGAFEQRSLGCVRVLRGRLEVDGSSAADSSWIEVLVDDAGPPALLRVLSPRLWARRLAAGLVQPQVSAYVSIA